MSDSIHPGAIPSGSRRSRIILLGIAGAVVIGTGGFLAGQAADADATGDSAADCATIRADSTDTLRAATSDPGSPGRQSTGTGEWWDTTIPASSPTPDRLRLREFVHVVLQNPGCYSVKERAQAQVLLDQLNSEG